MYKILVGQEEILTFLEKHPDEWFCALDIKRELDDEYNISSVMLALKKLLTLRDITSKEELKYKTNKKTKYYRLA